jgi:transposase
MAKNRYRVTDEKIELILSLKNEGNNERDIAKAVQLSQGTINRIVNKKYVHIEAQKPKVTEGMFSWNDYDNSIL